MERISLDENDFKALIAGQIIEKDGVKICLQDVGYVLMLSLPLTQMDMASGLEGEKRNEICFACGALYNKTDEQL